MGCLALSASLAAFLASAPVTIYVGPAVRDGFVEADKGVLDSIKDVQNELRKKRTFAVVANEAAASLKLYVVTRRKAPAGDLITGSVVAGVIYSVQDELHRLETLLRVGNYERAFVVESKSMIGGTWKHCAELIVKDLVTWAEANRERL